MHYYPDHVAAATAGKRLATAPETRRSFEVAPVGSDHCSSRWPGANAKASPEPEPWCYPGRECEGAEADENSSSQLNGSASGRDDIGPDLVQRHGVTGLGGPDG